MNSTHRIGLTSRGQAPLLGVPAVNPPSHPLRPYQADEAPQLADPTDRVRQWLRLFSKSTDDPPADPPEDGDDGSQGGGESSLDAFLSSLSTTISLAGRVPPEELLPRQAKDLLALAHVMQSFLGLIKNV